MSEDNKRLLEDLVAIGKKDAGIARTVAERKKIETDLATKRSLLEKRSSELQNKQRIAQEKRARYHKEERAVKDEREKLVARRKALVTLSTYKLQQAASREIEHSSRDIDMRDTGLLTMLDEVETLEREVVALTETLAALKTEYERQRAEADTTFLNFEERIRIYQSEREEIAKRVDSASLSIYGKVRDKHPMDPVMPIQNNTCSGCFQSLGPQVIVQISRGTSLVRCAGCGRILYIEESKEASKEE